MPQNGVGHRAFNITSHHSLRASFYIRQMSSAPWEPEWVVTPELARSLIEEAWPELAPVKAIDLAAGWDNTGFVINDSFVFRFPRRRIAIPLIQTEVRLLPWLAPQLPLRIPIPLYVGSPSERYPCSFAGYPMIPGSTLTAIPVSDGTRQAFARPLAHFLAALHSASATQAKSLGAPEDELGRLDITKGLPRTRERLKKIVDAGVPCDESRIEYLMKTLPSIEQPRVDTVVHGDLHSSQVVLNEQHEIVGIIDWGDIHIGDAAVDFAGIHAMLPRQCHVDFLTHYGPVDEVVWAAARGRALWNTIARLAQGVDVGDTATILETQSCLERLVD